MKHNDSDTNFRPFGQTTISSFLSKPRLLQEEDEQSNAPNQSKLDNSTNKDSVKVTTKIIKEKKSSFSSIGVTSKRIGIEEKKETDNLILNEAIFKQFNSLVPKKDTISVKENAGNRNDPELETSESEVCFDSRKRMNPFGNDLKNSAPKLLVLGDDPKPRRKPMKRVTPEMVDKRGKPIIYNHYQNGKGWWDGDREGVDNEEVGWTEEMWEGMGSCGLGNL